MPQIFVNNLTDELSLPIAGTATLLYPKAIAKFPLATPDNWYYLTLTENCTNKEASWEIIKVVGVISDTLVIERGKDNTVARGWEAGSTISLRITAADMTKSTTPYTPDYTYLAPILSPVFGGTPSAPTPLKGDVSEVLSTTRFVSTAINDAIELNKAGKIVIPEDGMTKVLSGKFAKANAGYDYAGLSNNNKFTATQIPSASLRTRAINGTIEWDLTTTQVLRIQLDCALTNLVIKDVPELDCFIGSQFQVVVLNGGGDLAFGSVFKWEGNLPSPVTRIYGKYDMFNFILDETIYSTPQTRQLYLYNIGMLLNVG